MITIKAKCEKHPRYKGELEPGEDECNTCWDVWEMRQAAEASVGYQDGLMVTVK